MSVALSKKPLGPPKMTLVSPSWWRPKKMLFCPNSFFELKMIKLCSGQLSHISFCFLSKQRLFADLSICAQCYALIALTKKRLYRSRLPSSPKFLKRGETLLYDRVIGWLSLGYVTFSWKPQIGSMQKSITEFYLDRHRVPPPRNPWKCGSPPWNLSKALGGPLETFLKHWAASPNLFLSFFAISANFSHVLCNRSQISSYKLQRFHFWFFLFLISPQTTRVWNGRALRRKFAG